MSDLEQEVVELPEIASAHLKEWAKLDKMFRFRWWSLRFLIRYYRTTKAVAREVRELTQNMPKRKVRP